MATTRRAQTWASRAADRGGDVRAAFRWPGQPNVHFHLDVPDGVYAGDGDGLRFEMLAVPTNADVLAILDRIMRRIARRLANDAAVGNFDEDAVPDVLALVQTEAASTLRRVFADDVLRCPCGGRRSVITVVTDVALARSLLTALGLASEPVTFAPARAPPQVDLAWDEAS